MAEPVIVTLDGPAGVGKSTLAKMLAGRLGLAYLDTGAMFRAVGRAPGTGPRNGWPPVWRASASDWRERARRPGSRWTAAPWARRSAPRTWACGPPTWPSCRWSAPFSRRPSRIWPGARPWWPRAGTWAAWSSRPRGTSSSWTRTRPSAPGGVSFSSRNWAARRTWPNSRPRSRPATARTAPLKPAPDALIVDTTDLDLEEVFEHILEAIITKAD